MSTDYALTCAAVNLASSAALIGATAWHWAAAPPARSTLAVLTILGSQTGLPCVIARGWHGRV
jgi:hypothetical protein